MSAEQLLAEVAAAAFDHDSRFDRFGPSNFWMRFLVFLNDLSLYLLRRSLPGARRAREAIAPLLRLYDELGISQPDVHMFITESALELLEMPAFSMATMAWETEVLPPEVEQIPTMLEIDAMRFYVWLGRTLDLAGAVVELGPWMGGSTACLATGLRQNKSYQGGKLHVFDAFIWRSWMSQFSTDPSLQARYQEGDSFLDRFNSNCSSFASLLHVKQGEVLASENRSTKFPLKWDDGEIGAIVFDHSDCYQANDEAWSIFAPSFVPERTVVVFNQYGNLRAEELRRFCRDRRTVLAPIHQLECSGRAFLFTGTS
jgi:hypothetical protein